ncbi:MAG: endonuclease/exonuclease/phosphatase family protein [Oscillospiraceae bacterium]|nr:endonuclease/exonuclease/phosphatase family protein [Oscillospiraceae bacterium]
MEKKVFILVTFILSILLLTVSALFLYREYTAEQIPAPPARTEIVAGGESSYRIKLAEDDRVCRIAAEYLSYLIKERTGVSLALCGPEAEEGRFLLLALDEAETQKEAPPYSLTLDPDENLCLSFRVRGEELACVHSLCAQWLTDTCGMEEDGTLWISQELIDAQLTGLSCSLPGRLRILTQNLRKYDDGGGNLILDRAARLMRLIRAESLDLIGTQETSLDWFNYLNVALSDQYAFFGSSQNGIGQDSGERNTICYRRDRFDLIAGDTFWLSDSSDQPSTLADGFHRRICTWVLLKDLETGSSFYFVNTHLDYENSEDYGEQAMLQLEVLFAGMDAVYASHGVYPVFLTGDFNQTPGSKTYDLALSRMRDTRTDALVNRSTVDYTFHNYGRSRKLLDYCFYLGDKVLILDYEIMTNGYGGFVSDHYGVMTDAFLYGFIS